MEKLLKLINEYEESRWTTIDDWLTEEERESWAIIEETPMWSEYEWHLRHCNAKTVAYEKDTFDHWALSKKYWFIQRLVEKEKLKRYPKELKTAIISKAWMLECEWYSDSDSLLMKLAIENDPIRYLISILW